MKVLISTILVFLIITAKGQNLRYTNTTEAGLIVGEDVKTTLNFQTFNGVKLKNKQFQIGVNTGIDKYTQLNIIPISLGFRWNPNSKETISPLIILNAGYGFGWLKPLNSVRLHSGGLLFNPTIGIKIKSGDKSAVNFTLGYKQQKASISDHYNGEYFLRVKESYVFRRAVTNIGVSF